MILIPEKKQNQKVTSYDNTIDLAWFLNRVPAHSIYRHVTIPN